MRLNQTTQDSTRESNFNSNHHLFKIHYIAIYSLQNVHRTRNY